MWRSAKSVTRAFFEALNRSRPDRAIAMVADDAHYIDSCGNRINGKSRCGELIEKLFAADPDYRHVIESMSYDGADVLVSGEVVSSAPDLSGRVLWKVRVEDGKIVSFQSFRANHPPAMVTMLLGDFEPA